MFWLTLEGLKKFPIGSFFISLVCISVYSTVSIFAPKNLYQSLIYLLYTNDISCEKMVQKIIFSHSLASHSRENLYCLVRTKARALYGRKLNWRELPVPNLRVFVRSTLIHIIVHLLLELNGMYVLESNVQMRI